jgi:hypothetical protein
MIEYLFGPLWWLPEKPFKLALKVSAYAMPILMLSKTACIMTSPELQKYENHKLWRVAHHVTKTHLVGMAVESACMGIAFVAAGIVEGPIIVVSTICAAGIVGSMYVAGVPCVSETIDDLMKEYVAEDVDILTQRYTQHTQSPQNNQDELK